MRTYTFMCRAMLVSDNVIVVVCEKEIVICKMSISTPSLSSNTRRRGRSNIKNRTTSTSNIKNTNSIQNTELSNVNTNTDVNMNMNTNFEEGGTVSLEFMQKKIEAEFCVVTVCNGFVVLSTDNSVGSVCQLIKIK